MGDRNHTKYLTLKNTVASWQRQIKIQIIKTFNRFKWVWKKSIFCKNWPLCFIFLEGAGNIRSIQTFLKIHTNWHTHSSNTRAKPETYDGFISPSTGFFCLSCAKDGLSCAKDGPSRSQGTHHSGDSLLKAAENPVAAIWGSQYQAHNP